MSLAKLLRHTRADQAVSQLELAMRLGISQRHISFLETGRSKPSRELLLAWMKELTAPASVLNAALTLAGFSQIRPGSGVQEPPVLLKSVPPDLRRLIDLHDPMPAFIFNALWSIVAINPAGGSLCSLLMPRYRPLLSQGPQGLDMVDALADEDGLLSGLREAPRVAAVLLQQLRREAWVQPALQDKAKRLEAALQARLGALPAVESGSFSAAPMHFDTEAGVLAFAAFQTVIASPEDVGSATLRIELWYPLDCATRAALDGATTLVQAGRTKLCVA